LSNAIQNFKRQNYIKCEAAVLLNHLLERKAKDTGWIVNWKVDSANNSLTSLFWILPDQQNLHLRYQDSYLVGQALINDKTVESYEWVLQTLITNTKAVPLTIITNNDLAVNAAIASILPDTNHIYCIYYIGQNLIKNLKGKLGERYNEFSQEWYQMRNSLSYQQFNYLQDNLLTKFPDASSYLNRALFGEKEHWALCHTSKIFSAEMQST
ncbi:41644_t:CDS:2, partial [Gigaspora margarita]